ncbi:MAG TPA: hypothetical protein VKY74_28175 [Chloroflexia bacterium]|nr:hypothetical protein [Chloroflexia bacterium]
MPDRYWLLAGGVVPNGGTVGSGGCVGNDVAVAGIWSVMLD